MYPFFHDCTKTNVQIWRLVFLNPVGVQRRTVSHFKGLFKTFKMRYSTFLYSYWIGLHVHFKKAILHLKRATVWFSLSICVWYIKIQKSWMVPNVISNVKILRKFYFSWRITIEQNQSRNSSCLQQKIVIFADMKLS